MLALILLIKDKKYLEDFRWRILVQILKCTRHLSLIAHDSSRIGDVLSFRSLTLFEQADLPLDPSMIRRFEKSK
jgi:hypothetical protein